jgi:hypothetical protein
MLIIGTMLSKLSSSASSASSFLSILLTRQFEEKETTVNANVVLTKYVAGLVVVNRNFSFLVDITIDCIANVFSRCMTSHIYYDKNDDHFDVDGIIVED